MRDSELTALVPDNPTKLKKLSKKYSVPNISSYEQYSECLESGEVDAVHIALPNSRPPVRKPELVAAEGPSPD